VKYIEHDGGRLGYAPNEKLDCTVRAVALAAGMPYAEAHALCKAHGRKDGHRMKNFVTFMKKTFPQVRRAGDCGITLGRWVTAHRHGIYLLRVRGHVVVVVDGVVLDLGEPRWRQMVNDAWCFKEGAS
jgi:hypothetical protein